MLFQCQHNIISSIKTIIISAVKGGTGKTKVTACLGKALARQDQRVAFLDLDYFAPNLDIELEVTSSLDGDGYGHIIPSKTPQGYEFVSFGQVYVQDQAVTVPEEAAVYEISQLLGDGYILWDSPDYLLIDTAPTSSAVIQASLMAPNSLGTIIVSQPSRVSRADLLRSISLMKDKRVPVLGVVINQGYYVCPQCGYHSAAYDLTPDDIQAAVKPWGIPILGIVPHESNLDGYFDAIATKIMIASPILLPEEKRVSKLPRRLISWISSLTTNQTAKQK